jgi:outer membrane immunogenic protein
MVRRIAFTLASAFALATAGHAADFGASGGYKDGPAYAAVNWSGWYAGVNGGGAWANDNQLVDLVSNAPSKFYGLSPSGGFGGGQIGYNLQGVWHPHLVLGLEADIQGAGISGRGSVTDTGTPPATFHFRSDLDYFGTVRGRVGYASGSTLVYLTGGLAYGGLSLSSDDFGTQKYNSTAVGYVLGGGFEYSINPAWSVKVEYQYLNFGKNDPTGNGGTFAQDVVLNGGAGQKDDDYHTVRAGLNYHVGSSYQSLK